MEYRRAYVPGGTYFFTVVTQHRRPILVGTHPHALLRAFAHVQAKHPFRENAFVILPDHIHTLWTLPPGDADFSTRWRLIKTYFTRHAVQRERPPISPSRRAKRIQGFWQHRFWEHVIRDETDFERHLDYIHYNPVKHGLVSRAGDWPHSSFHAYVQRGLYDADWGSAPP
ncbi:MAG: transposase [Rhodothermales bacterium]